MDEKALGQRLQLARKRAKLTQQELCQKAGLSYSTLAKIERGAIRSPSVFTVAAIAEATGTPIEKLLDIRKAEGPTAGDTKKRSKNGVSFVYFDVNGTLARFFERAFTKIAAQADKPIEQVETLFWRYDNQACEGKLSPQEANRIFAKELGIRNFDWRKFYMAAAEPTPHSSQLLKWVSQHYDIGILSNNWLGFTEAMVAKKLVPKLKYAAIVESAKVGFAKPDPKIYKLAEELAGVPAEEILLVDDNPAYLKAANTAGWQVMWFDGYRPEYSVTRVKSALEF